jgi:site-specific DNA recombinase
MQVAIYARVSTLNQKLEGTIASQVQLLKQHVQQQGWNLLPEHEFLDDGFSGPRLDRPALDRLRSCAQRGEFDAVVVLEPDRLAREYAHQWLLVEEFKKFNVQLVFLRNPFGDTPQGKLLTQMQGMIAEYERTQILERTRRGRLEKARRGEFMPWAYTCYGYQYLPKRHGGTAQVMINPTEAEVVRSIYRAAVEEGLSCRQITKRLNQSQTPTPSGKNRVWQPAVVGYILTNRVYAGTARFNYRQSVIPKHRKTDDESKLQSLKTGRSYRPESEWILSEAPTIITAEIFEKAQLELARHREAAHRIYRPSSHRYLLRTLVKCGECGLAMFAKRQHSKDKKYEYLYYECVGHHPLTVGRTTKCRAKSVRADRLDQVVWQTLTQLLNKPEAIPQLHQHWAEAKQQSISSLDGQQSQLLQRRQRIERQDQRLLDAYQIEIINLSELQARRQKLSAELQQIEMEIRQLANVREQTIHWKQVIENAETFHRLLGDNLDRLSFEERQAVSQCLIKKVTVTGEEVDIHFVLPFESTPQAVNRQSKEPEGAPGHFYRLRLAHLARPTFDVSLQDGLWLAVQSRTGKVHRVVLTQAPFCHQNAEIDGKLFQSSVYLTDVVACFLLRRGDTHPNVPLVPKLPMMLVEPHSIELAIRLEAASDLPLLAIDKLE